MIYYCWLALLMITAGLIIHYDSTRKEIPLPYVVLNYLCLCTLTSPLLVIGLVFIFLAYYWKQPVDWLYVFVIGYLFIIFPFSPTLLFITMGMLIFILNSKDEERISFMAPLEVILVALLTLR